MELSNVWPPLSEVSTGLSLAAFCVAVIAGVLVVFLRERNRNEKIRRKHLTPQDFTGLEEHSGTGWRSHLAERRARLTVVVAGLVIAFGLGSAALVSVRAVSGTVTVAPMQSEMPQPVKASRSPLSIQITQNAGSASTQIVNNIGDEQ